MIISSMMMEVWSNWDESLGHRVTTMTLLGTIHLLGSVVSVPKPSSIFG
jgi:hypothetical protein